MKKSIFSGLVLALLVMLGAASQARAQAPCGTSGGTTNIPVIVNLMTGSCVITGSLTAPEIVISAPGGISISGSLNSQDVVSLGAGGALSVGAITTQTGFTNLVGATVTTGNINTEAGYTYIQSTTGAISTGSIISAGSGNYLQVVAQTNFTASSTINAGGNILVVAQGSIVTGKITGGNDANIDLKANQAGNGSLTIGSGGVAGIAAGMNGVVYVTNGASGATGTLTLGSTSNLITVPASSGDYIILNAQDGTLSVQSGLSNTGSTGPAGQIQLLANEVQFGNNVTLTAAQTYSTSSDHGVAIAAKTISYGGTTTGLQLIGDGPGGWAYLLPQGGTTITDTEEPTDLVIDVDNTNDVQAPISVEGASGSPLEMTANGDDGLVLVQGYPLSFTGGAVTLQANAASGQEVEIENPGTLTGQTGLTFGGTGTVTINANGSGGPGGYVYINVDQAVVSAPTLSISTNGPSTGSGNGGTLYFNTTKASLTGQTVSITNNGSSTGTGNAGSATQFYSSGAIQLPTQTFTMTANGASGGSGNGGPIYFGGTATTIPGSLKSTLTANAGGAGTGNGGTVTLSPTSSVTLGNNVGEFALSATGGSTGGNGGTITVQPYSGNITVDDTATPISVAVRGTTGNGGTITLDSTDLNFNGTASQLSADGGTTSGNGGTIIINASGTALTIGTGSAGNVKLSAKAPGNGNGGTIDVTDYTGITINSSYFTVQAGPTGNGKGGTIGLTGGPTNLTGSFSVNGVGTGTGGIIDFSVGSLTFNGTQSFTANSLGTGQGGDISFNTTYAGQAGTLTLGANTTLQATSTSGNGGTVTITAASQPIALTGGGVTVTAGGNGNGGTIAVTSTANTLTVSGALNTNGAGTGNGGSITLEGDAVSIGSSTFSANAATSGTGGNVTITDTGSGNQTIISLATFSVIGGGSSAGGKVSINQASTTNSNTAVNIHSFTVNSGADATDDVFDGSVSLNGIICTQFKNTISVWPASPATYWYCGIRSGDEPTLILSNMQALNAAPLAAMANAKTDLFVFAGVPDSDKFLGTSAQQEENANNLVIAGYFTQASNWIVVLEGQEVETTVTYYSDVVNAADARHEVGHDLDIQWAGLVGRSWVSQIGGNQQQSFNGFVTHDFRNLTYEAPSYTAQLPACGTGAIFEGLDDPRSGSPICPLSGDLVGLNNQQIVQTVAPYYMTLYTDNEWWRELWPELFAVVSGAVSTTNFVDTILFNYFPCSQIYEKSLNNSGSVAPLSSYPAACTN